MHNLRYRKHARHNFSLSLYMEGVSYKWSTLWHNFDLDPVSTIAFVPCQMASSRLPPHVGLHILSFRWFYSTVLLNDTFSKWSSVDQKLDAPFLNHIHVPLGHQTYTVWRLHTLHTSGAEEIVAISEIFGAKENEIIDVEVNKLGAAQQVATKMKCHNEVEEHLRGGFQIALECHLRPKMFVERCSWKSGG